MAPGGSVTSSRRRASSIPNRWVTKDSSAFVSRNACATWKAISESSRRCRWQTSSLRAPPSPTRGENTPFFLASELVEWGRRWSSPGRGTRGRPECRWADSSCSWRKERAYACEDVRFRHTATHGASAPAQSAILRADDAACESPNVSASRERSAVERAPGQVWCQRSSSTWWPRTTLLRPLRGHLSETL